MDMLVNIDVPDLDAAIAFYQRATELKLVRLLFEGTVAELAGAPVPVLLLQKDPATSPVPGTLLARDYQRHWTPVHLDFVVSDLDKATEKAVAAGAKLEGPIQQFVWGSQACLSDPYGHGFCLVQWQGGGYDAVAL